MDSEEEIDKSNSETTTEDLSGSDSASLSRAHPPLNKSKGVRTRDSLFKLSADNLAELNATETETDTEADADVIQVKPRAVSTRKDHTFVFSTPEQTEKAKKGELGECSAQMTISIGYPETPSGATFYDILENALNTFGTITIMVDDSIQWYTLRLLPEYSHLSSEELKAKAIENGDKWIKNNKILAIQKEYGDKLVLKRWCEFPQDQIDAAKERMREKYTKFCSEKWALAYLTKKIKNPESDKIYIRHEHGRLFYEIALLNERDDKGNVIRKQFELTRDDLKDALLREGHPESFLDPLFDPANSLCWSELRNKYTQVICDSVNPIKLGIDYTAKKFIERKSSQIDVESLRKDAVFAIVTEYLIEECGVMAELWPRVDYEIYPAARTAAMKAIHEHILRVREEETQPLLDPVKIRENHDSKQELIGLASLFLVFKEREPESKRKKLAVQKPEECTPHATRK